MIAPVLDEIARENEDRYRVAKVDIDANPELMERFNVRAVPTLLFFQGGQLKDQLVGGAPKKAILDKLSALGAPPGDAKA